MSIIKLTVARNSALTIFAILLVLVLIFLSCKPPVEVSELDSRTNSLNKSIMCPICPGESIDQSQNELAGHMRRIVREQIEGGKTDSEVREYFVERYGPVVLLEPSTSGIGLIAWIVPPVGLLIAGCSVAIALILMKRRRNEEVVDDILSHTDRVRYYKVLEERGISEDALPGREV